MAMRKRKPIASEVPSPETRPMSMISIEDIAQQAYALYLARGRKDGHDLEDWLQAERKLQEGKQTYFTSIDSR